MKNKLKCELTVSEILTSIINNTCYTPYIPLIITQPVPVNNSS